MATVKATIAARTPKRDATVFDFVTMDAHSVIETPFPKQASVCLVSPCLCSAVVGSEGKFYIRSTQQLACHLALLLCCVHLLSVHNMLLLQQLSVPFLDLRLL